VYWVDLRCDGTVGSSPCFFCPFEGERDLFSMSKLCGVGAPEPPGHAG
jgi:hypothetical protein